MTNQYLERLGKSINYMQSLKLSSKIFEESAKSFKEACGRFAIKQPFDIDMIFESANKLKKMAYAIRFRKALKYRRSLFYKILG